MIKDLCIVKYSLVDYHELAYQIFLCNNTLQCELCEVKVRNRVYVLKTLGIIRDINTKEYKQIDVNENEVNINIIKINNKESSYNRSLKKQ